MIRHLYVFQRELDEEASADAQILAIGRRMDRSKRLIGRCVRCGAHFTRESEFCAECLGTDYCSCRECMQVASLYRMLLNDLYWAGRDCCDDKVYRDHLMVKTNRMRDILVCREVAA